MFELPPKETQIERQVKRMLSPSSAATRQVGHVLGRSIRPGTLVLLAGPIGAGKTVLARGMAEALGVTNWRGSPTFTIINEYETSPPFYHVDLYRLAEGEIEELGLEEYVRPDSLVVVEWPERAASYLRQLSGGSVLWLDLDITDPEKRVIEVSQGDAPALLKEITLEEL